METKRDICIREMVADDLDFATFLTHSAGWMSESREVFEAFLDHDPHGCFIAEAGGEKGGVCVATKYLENGFIGELVVSKHMRLLGIGQKLFQKALDCLLAAKTKNIYLDGDLNAVSYYESMGFRKICRSLRFRGKIKGKKHAHIRRLQASDLDRLCALDREFFGDDRGFFLRRRADNSLGMCLVAEREGRPGGWIMSRPGDGLLAVGPWAALGGDEEASACWSTWPVKTARRFFASASWKETRRQCVCSAPGTAFRKPSIPGSWSGARPSVWATIPPCMPSAPGPRAERGAAMQSPSIAVLSDIHGNRWALEAVLADIRRRGIRAHGQPRRLPVRPAGPARHGADSVGAGPAHGARQRGPHHPGRPGTPSRLALRCLLFRPSWSLDTSAGCGTLPLTIVFRGFFPVPRQPGKRQ